MITNHQEFINAIHDKKKLKIVFYSEEDNALLERICAPMDYAAGTRIKDGVPRYWVWDFNSDTKNHTLPLRDGRIKSIIVLEETFDPSDFITWLPKWAIARDWDKFS